MIITIDRHGVMWLSVVQNRVIYLSRSPSRTFKIHLDSDRNLDCYNDDMYKNPGKHVIESNFTRLKPGIQKGNIQSKTIGR